MGKAAAVLAAAGGRCRCTVEGCRGHLEWLYCGRDEDVIVVPSDPAVSASKACEDGTKLIAMCRGCVKRRETRTKEHAEHVVEHQTGGLW
jgi:hypothetical protein